MLGSGLGSGLVLRSGLELSLERLLSAQVVWREVHCGEVVLLRHHPRHGVLEPHGLLAVVLLP